MEQQDVKLQIQALEQLKIELEGLVKKLEEQAGTYFKRVQALAKSGLDVTVTEKYEKQYWQKDYALLSQLRQHITENDLKYVERCLTSAKGALASYQG